MTLRGADQPLVRLGRIDQHLGKADLVLAREPHDLSVFDDAPCVLAGGGDEIAGQGQAAQAGGALHLVIDLDRNTRFQPRGIGFDLGLGHKGLLCFHHIRQNAVLFKMLHSPSPSCRLRLNSQSMLQSSRRTPLM